MLSCSFLLRALSFPCTTKRETDIDTHREAISDVMTGQFGLIQRMRLTVELFGEDGRSIERCPNNGGSGLRVVNG